MLANSDGAIKSLERSIDRGWRSAWWTKTDPNLALLREDARYREVFFDLNDHIKSEAQAAATAGG